MSRSSAFIQGTQRLHTKKPSSQEMQKVVKQALKRLETHDSPGAWKKSQQGEVQQGVQRQFHAPSNRYLYSVKSGKHFGAAYEPWSDDMACVLQGSCLPGSTRYCRTNSMFGKVALGDISQGAFSVPHRKFHTFRPYIQGHISKQSETVQPLSTLTSPPRWSDDMACILQGTCLPGSTKYCRTASMFGKHTFYDVNQGGTTHQFSTDGGNSELPREVSLTQRQKLKQAVRDYGSTVVVFHVCISLISLGGFYLAVQSGIDVQKLLQILHFSEDIIKSKVASGASTFVMAYAVHKVFAPVRIAITLTCTPFIVRYLRQIGFLKLKSVANTKV